MVFGCVSFIVTPGITQGSLMYVEKGPPRLTGLSCCGAASIKKQLAYSRDHEKLLHCDRWPQYALQHARSHDSLSPTPLPSFTARPPRFVYVGTAEPAIICSP